MASNDKRPVVVTTEHKGVFFGLIPDREVFLHPADSKAITLTDAQMCVYWSADVEGILGLAASGPTRSCKVTRAVPEMVVTDVTAVISATGGAVKAWQDRPWS